MTGPKRSQSSSPVLPSTMSGTPYLPKVLPQALFIQYRPQGGKDAQVLSLELSLVRSHSMECGLALVSLSEEGRGARAGGWAWRERQAAASLSHVAGAGWG